MTDRLFVFALSARGDLRHTHLTRAQGTAPGLPPLTDWVGAEIDTDAIELFPVSDLGDMTLSDYIGLAFAPEPIPQDDRRRIDAIRGTVLLVPSNALPQDPRPVPPASLVASLRLLRANHIARLPKADIRPPPRQVSTPVPTTAQRESLTWGFVALVMITVFVLLLVL